MPLPANLPFGSEPVLTSLLGKLIGKTVSI
jgi:hypothetical protein